MKNVAEILNIAETGDLSGAHQALDALLAMGPRNIEALKLRARLLEVAGRFQQEAKIWEEIAKIDRDDHDLETYIVRRQSEDRENFYFTDALPEGGKRFIAFPRKMVRAATVGLVGCILFLTIAQLSQQFPILNLPIVMLTSFGILVIGPWIAILYSYLRSLRYVSVTRTGIEVAMRLKKHNLPWSEVESVFLAQEDRHDTYSLSLLIVGRGPDKPVIEIDFNEPSTAIRARSYFVKEIMLCWGEPQYTARKLVSEHGRSLIKA